METLSDDLLGYIFLLLRDFPCALLFRQLSKRHNKIFLEWFWKPCKLILPSHIVYCVCDNCSCEDVKIISEILEDEDNTVVQEAVEEYVERSIENGKDSLMPYTLADSIVEVQVEQFLENPIQSLVNVDISDINIKDIAYLWTLHQNYHMLLLHHS